MLRDRWRRATGGISRTGGRCCRERRARARPRIRTAEGPAGRSGARRPGRPRYPSAPGPGAPSSGRPRKAGRATRRRNRSARPGPGRLMRSVVVWDKRAPDRGAGGPVVPDADGMASSRWVMRAYRPSVVRPPWRSRSSWPLKVSLTDSIHRRIQPMDPWRGASSRRSGWTPATTGGRDHMIVDLHIQCGQEGVQVVRHSRSWAPPRISAPRSREPLARSLDTSSGLRPRTSR
jgi:hypothetical protein